MQAAIDHVPEFESQLREALGLVKNSASPQELGEVLVAQSTVLEAEISALVGAAAENLKESPIADTDELLMAYHLNFQWAELAKGYLLLWRDSLFEVVKGLVGIADGKFTAEAVTQLSASIRSLLVEAAAELREQIQLGLAALQPHSRENKKKLSAWRLQKNPWPIYQEQFGEIPKQCQRIWGSGKDMQGVAQVLQESRELVIGMTTDCIAMAERVSALVQEASEICQELLSDHPEKHLGKMASKLEDYEGMLDFPNLLSGFNPKLEDTLAQLPETLEFPVGMKGGMVELMEIPFHRRTQSWLKSEVLQLTYDIWELTESSRNESRMTFVNLQNWAIMLSHEIKEGHQREVDAREFVQLTTELQKRLDSSIEKMHLLAAKVEQRLDANFRVMEIYATEREFLPVELQSRIEQLRQNQDKLFEGIRRFFKQMVDRGQQFLKLVEQEESLSTSEKLIRFLQEREADPANAQYASIFLTKGFVSTSFIVGRKDEFEHANNVIETWRKGYRGSLLLTGQRLSGKTLFGELIATRCFDHNTIRLHPNSLFTVEGRKYETSCDLGQALEHIRRHTLSSPTLIWIDNLENWWDSANSYFSNGQAVKHFLEHQGRNSFLMISMSNTLRPRLDKLLDWHNLFLAHINLDKMPAADVREAILIRHSATQQKLVNDNGEELSPQEFKKISQAVHSSAGGNIGEALNKWAISSRLVDESSVRNLFKPGHALPDFIDEDLGILLSSIIMQRRTNESQLRRKFGPAFSPKYALLVRRLLNTGVLLRGIDGRLEVNPILVNDLGDLLHRKRYLRYKD